MNELLVDSKRKKKTQDDIKTDIAAANTTANLSKAYIQALAMEYKIDCAKTINQQMLGEL